MNAERGIDPRLLEYAVADHRLRAVRDFFGGLKRELDAAAQLEGSEPARYFEPDRDVPVVAARVHLAGLLGAVRDRIGFFDGKRVHVRAEENATSVAPLQAHDAGFS